MLYTQKETIMFTFKNFAVFLLIFAFDGGLSQEPETNDQELGTTAGTVSDETPTNITNLTAVNTNLTEIDVNLTEVRTRKQFESEEPNIIVKTYLTIEFAIRAFLSHPKVRYVFHNIGICVVNGVMDLVTYFLPAPMIPLLASAAGMVIPFEPVVSLREKMPVTSYRRAFNSAVNSFMGTFDKYKENDFEDPYMTRRFNRRFMNDASKDETTTVHEYI